jgi:hypothetical protein
MPAVTFTGLPLGETAGIYYAARVEPYRQGLRPLPSDPIASIAVDQDGKATFNLTERIEYVIFTTGGFPGRNCMVSTTRGGS